MSPLAKSHAGCPTCGHPWDAHDGGPCAACDGQCTATPPPLHAEPKRAQRAPGEPPKPLDVLRGHMATGRWREALKLAASWQQLGTEAKAIRQGWEGYARPEFQRQLRRSPEALIEAGKAALVRRYGRPQVLHNTTERPMAVWYGESEVVHVPPGGEITVWQWPDGKLGAPPAE